MPLTNRKTGEGFVLWPGTQAGLLDKSQLRRWRKYVAFSGVTIEELEAGNVGLIQGVIHVAGEILLNHRRLQAQFRRPVGRDLLNMLQSVVARLLENSGDIHVGWNGLQRGFAYGPKGKHERKQSPALPLLRQVIDVISCTGYLQGW